MPDKVSGGELVTVKNASHTGFSGPASALRWLNNPDAIGCWAVQQNISAADEEPWYELIGTEAQGIDHNAVNELCLMDPLPPAMNVLRQQMITAVVVTSWFQLHFAPTVQEREAAGRYLRSDLARELAEVSYSSS